MFYRHWLCVVSQRVASITFQFTWGRYKKHQANMLIGTSPELEIALYTICYRARPNTTCSVSYYGTEFQIRTGIALKDGALLSAYFSRFNPAGAGGRRHPRSAGGA